MKCRYPLCFLSLILALSPTCVFAQKLGALQNLKQGIARSNLEERIKKGEEVPADVLFTATQEEPVDPDRNELSAKKCDAPVRSVDPKRFHLGGVAQEVLLVVEGN